MKYTCILLCFVLFSGCRTSRVDNKALSTIPKREHTIQTVLWQQQSAEYRALCHQAYNTARYSLEDILAQKRGSQRPLAIITDIDETLIDNSPYNAKMIQTDKDYSKEDWIAWGRLEKAEVVPGALDFLDYAASRGVQIFYISNRYVVQDQETKANLKRLGFPFIEDDHFLLRATTSGKEERRKIVQEDHEVIMLLGDNLSDFLEAFDKKPTEERNQLVEYMRSSFGTQFIVLPNPMYGDWETKGIYGGRYDWTPAQKDSIRRAKLRAY